MTQHVYLVLEKKIASTIRTGIKTEIGVSLLYSVPLGDVVDLECRGCRKLKRGNTAVPMHVSLCEVRCCCTAAVGLSVYCAGAFEIQKKCGSEPSRLCSGWHTKHTCVHTQRHRSWLSQRGDLEVRLLWLPQRINRFYNFIK